MKEQLIGWWVLSAGYSWLVRTTFEVDALSAWNWGPILVFLLIMMCVKSLGAACSWHV